MSSKPKDRLVDMGPYYRCEQWIEDILIPDMQSGRAGIRFHSDERYGVLYCGATTDVGQMTAGRYPHLKMEDKGWKAEDM